MSDTARKSKCCVWIALGSLFVWVLVLLVTSRPGDFASFYAAGHLLRTHPHSLYSLQAQRAASICPTMSCSPGHILLRKRSSLLPLTLFGVHPAFLVWSAISIAAFILSGWLLRDELHGLTAGTQFALLAFGCFPVSNGLVAGQDHGLFLLLWVLAYRRWRAGDDFTSGLWIGLSLIRYQFALPMLLFFVVLRAWKLLQGFALSGGAMLALSFLLVGQRLVPSYLGTLRSLALLSDAGALRSFPTLRGLAALLLPSHGAVAAAAGVVCLLAWALFTVRRMSRRVAFCFAMVVSLLVDPHAYLYELTVLLIPLAMFLRARPQFAMLGFAVGSLCFASAFMHMNHFSILCPVLLIGAIRMSRPCPAQRMYAPAGSGIRAFSGLLAVDEE